MCMIYAWCTASIPRPNHGVPIYSEDRICSFDVEAVTKGARVHVVSNDVMALYAVLSSSAIHTTNDYVVLAISNRHPAVKGTRHRMALMDWYYITQYGIRSRIRAGWAKLGELEVVHFHTSHDKLAVDFDRDAINWTMDNIECFSMRYYPLREYRICVPGTYHIDVTWDSNIPLFRDWASMALQEGWDITNRHLQILNIPVYINPWR